MDTKHTQELRKLFGEDLPKFVREIAKAADAEILIDELHRRGIDVVETDQLLNLKLSEKELFIIRSMDGEQLVHELKRRGWAAKKDGEHIRVLQAPPPPLSGLDDGQETE